eukprot:952119-Rhodomonas_salina.2
MLPARVSFATAMSRCLVRLFGQLVLVLTRGTTDAALLPLEDRLRAPPPRQVHTQRPSTIQPLYARTASLLRYSQYKTQVLTRCTGRRWRTAFWSYKYGDAQYVRRLRHVWSYWLRRWKNYIA